VAEALPFLAIWGETQDTGIDYKVSTLPGVDSTVRPPSTDVHRPRTVTASTVRSCSCTGSVRPAGNEMSVTRKPPKSAVVNRGLLSSVVENEPMVESKLAGSEGGAGLPSAIPQGMRAMSVRVNDVIGVAGFLDPGTRVDLMVTIRKKDESTSRTVASNVQVLTAGTRSDQQRPKDAKTPASGPPAAAVVTLLVTPEDAERIALAQSEGQIMLSLRNPLDTEQTESEGVRTAALFGDAPEPPAPVVKPVSVRRAPPAPVAVSAPPPPPKMYTVEAIRAAKRSEEVVH